MGYMRHNAVIVTAAGDVMRGERDGVPAPDVEAFRQSLPEKWRRLVTGPVRSVMEDYVTFAFLPDGSHEGWDDSNLGDELRQRFLDLFTFAHEDGSTPFDVLDVRFGGDVDEDFEPAVIATLGPRTTACG